jgi:hypothetical protein
MRLAFDLGLHVDGEPYVEQGLFTAKEAEARRGAFWSCVVVNQYVFISTQSRSNLSV